MLRMSNALAYLIAGDVGARRGISNFYLDFFTGAQPADANQAVSGQKIISFRKGTTGLEVVTMPVRARWTITLAGASGSVNTITIAGFDILGGAVNFTSTLDNTRDLIVAQINNSLANLDFIATAGGSGVFYIDAPYGTGTGLNALVMATTVTTMTATVSSAGAPTTAGVAPANCCNFLPPVDGATLTPATINMNLNMEVATWIGKAGYDKSNSAIAGFTSGSLTAGWCRLKASAADDDTLSTSVNGFVRIDMSIGASVSDIIVDPTLSFAWGAINQFNSFLIKLPKIVG